MSVSVGNIKLDTERGASIQGFTALHGRLLISKRGRRYEQIKMLGVFTFLRVGNVKLGVGKSEQI